MKPDESHWARLEPKDQPEPRDPRIDPMPGDVLRKGDGIAEVCTVAVNTFNFKWDGPMVNAPAMTHWSEDWRGAWRKWASDAEIVRRAP